MTAIKITDKQLAQACHYIARQFTAHSWWPSENPSQAKQEFELMKTSTAALNVWCERWLDDGQRQKLHNALKRRNL